MSLIVNNLDKERRDQENQQIRGFLNDAPSKEKRRQIVGLGVRRSDTITRRMPLDNAK